MLLPHPLSEGRRGPRQLHPRCQGAACIPAHPLATDPRCSRPSSGALRLRFTPSFAIYLLAPLIRRYRDRFPGIALTVTEVAQEEVDSFGLSPQWLSHSPAPS